MAYAEFRSDQLSTCYEEPRRWPQRAVRAMAIGGAKGKNAGLHGLKRLRRRLFVRRTSSPPSERTFGRSYAWCRRFEGLSSDSEPICDVHCRTWLMAFSTEAPPKKQLQLSTSSC